MEKQNLIITIGRQYGSGGAEVGKKLGQRMGLDVYDKEILKMTSDESGIREKGYYEEHEIARNIRRMDRERRDYHRYYTGKEWENVENYDMMLNSGVLGTDGCVECILSYLKIRGLYPA